MCVHILFVWHPFLQILFTSHLEYQVIPFSPRPDKGLVATTAPQTESPNQRPAEILTFHHQQRVGPATSTFTTDQHVLRGGSSHLVSA